MKTVDIKFEEIDLLKNLWEKNRLYHEKTSEYFGYVYQSICFEERMEKLRNMNMEMYKVSIYRDDEKVIGYCISTIENGIGEIESIHVDEPKRGNGIGEKLIKRHLNWLNEMNCKSIGLTVSQENKLAIKFYKKLGFYPCTLHMEQLHKIE